MSQMKIIFSITHALFLVVCCVLLAGNGIGQTATNSELPPDIAAKMAKIDEKRAEWRRQHPQQEAEEIALMSNAISHWEAPKALPKSAKNKKIIEHCVEQLHFAFDTNEIQLACSKLTNQPEAAITLKNLLEETISNLNLLATMLTSPDLSDITLGDDGWSAEMYSQKYYYYVCFWIANGEPSSVRSIELRTPDAGHVILSARFYENEKLFIYENNTHPRRSQLSFKEDGHLNRYQVQKPAKKP
jgi:hypothetical protein